MQRLINLCMIILYIVLVFLCVNKPDGIADNDIYKYYYKNFQNVDVEPTFKWISSLSGEYPTLLLIYAILSIGLKIFAIRNFSVCISISVLDYLAMYFVLHDMIQIRCAVASGLFLCSLPYLKDHNFKYFIIVFIAFLFHNSSILFVFFWFLKSGRINKLLYLSLIPLSYIMVLLDVNLTSLMGSINLDIVANYYDAYSNNSDFEKMSVFGPVILFRIFISTICVIKSDKLSLISPYSNLLIKIYILSVISYIIFMDLPVMAGRISELLGITEILVLALFTKISRAPYLKIIPIMYCTFMFIVRQSLLLEL